MFKVGLTGGIASGKTRVAEFFAARGITVIDSDQIAREIVAAGAPVLAAIQARFGDGVIAVDGSLDRRALRAMVFADPAARRDLEAITHPAIRARMAELNATATATLGQQGNCIDDIGAGRRNLDRVLVVDCPEDMQVARVMTRDRVDEAGARAVLAAQASRAARLAIADDVITNDGNLAALESAVAVLHERYLQLSAAR